MSEQAIQAPVSAVPPAEPDDANSLENSSSWYIATKAFAIRQAASLAFGVQNMTLPAISRPSKTLWLDSTLGTATGKNVIKVDVWLPPSDSTATTLSDQKRPAIINFHGGGFILGQGTDDSRWAGAAVTDLGAVIFSVNYRLAPGHPFPKAVEDCVDAVVQLVAQAPQDFAVDPAKIVLSGFSAGGNLALASWLVLQDPRQWDYSLPAQTTATATPLAGLCLFYPLLDWTVERARKRGRAKRPDLALPRNLTDLFDISYVPAALRPSAARGDLRLSPGLMPDEMLARLPPVHLCLCEWDMLEAEGLAFADRLKARGGAVTVRVVESETHGWDKNPTQRPKPSVAVEYTEALNSIKGWLDGGRSGA